MKLQTSALRIALAATALLVVLIVAGIALKAGSPQAQPAAVPTLQAVTTTTPLATQALRTVVVTNPLTQSGVAATAVVPQANGPAKQETREGSPRHKEDDDD